MATEEKSTGIKAVLEAFGFVSNEARRNLIIFFLVLLIFSNALFIYLYISSNKSKDAEIKQLNNDKLMISQQVTEEVRKQIKPVSEKVIEAANNVNNAAITLDSTAKQQQLNKNLK